MGKRYGVRKVNGGYAVADLGYNHRGRSFPPFVDEQGRVIDLHDPDDVQWMQLTQREAQELADALTG